MSYPFDANDDAIEALDDPRTNSKEDIGGPLGWTRPAPKPVTFAIPPSSPAKPCRSCKAPIHWAEHPRTKAKMPLNPDGTSHFATCPNAPQHRATAKAQREQSSGQRSLFGDKP